MDALKTIVVGVDFTAPSRNALAQAIRIAKARDIKQAMAQALLTGRIRLVEGAAA